jgi:hypothetical protein
MLRALSKSPAQPPSTFARRYGNAPMHTTHTREHARDNWSKNALSQNGY